MREYFTVGDVSLSIIKMMFSWTSAYIDEFKAAVGMGEFS